MSESFRRVRAALCACVCVVAMLVASMTLLAISSPASMADSRPDPGVPATVTADALSTWQVNGVVWSQVTVGNTVYAAGRFTKARPPGVAEGGAGEVAANNVFAYDIRTGGRVVSFNHQLNAQALAITRSPDGSKVFVGGDFTTVDNQPRAHVAVFDTATNKLSSVAPSVGGQVRSLAATNSTLYAGGSFTKAGGLLRTRLAALSTSNGSVTPWTASADDNSVWAMTLSPDGSRLIVGGAFTTLNGLPAYGMGSLSTTTGKQLPWAANQTIRDAGSAGAITALRADGGQIYGAGYNYGGGGNFEGTFAADPGTGAIKWLNDCHGDTYDVLPVGSVLYDVGHAHTCQWVGEWPETSPRSFHYAMASTTYATGKNVGPDEYGWNFNNMPAAHHLHWWPRLSQGTFTGQYQATWSLTGNADFVALGGEFPRVNGAPQQGLVRYARTDVAPGVAPNKMGIESPNLSVIAESVSSGTARVSWPAQWDADNENIRYYVYRDGGATRVYTVVGKSSFWVRPTIVFTDKGLAPGSSHTYKVKASDPFGNSTTSLASAPVKIS